MGKKNFANALLTYFNCKAFIYLLFIFLLLHDNTLY